MRHLPVRNILSKTRDALAPEILVASRRPAAEKHCINETALVRRSPDDYLLCSYRLGRILDCLRRENQRIMG
jgi:hypothetical protein